VMATRRPTAGDDAPKPRSSRTRARPSRAARASPRPPVTPSLPPDLPQLRARLSPQPRRHSLSTFVAPVALLAAVTSVLWILSDSGVLYGSPTSHPATTSNTHHQARQAARSRTHAASSLTASGAASTGAGAGGATTRIYYRVQAGDTLASIAQ